MVFVVLSLLGCQGCSSCAPQVQPPVETSNPDSGRDTYSTDTYQETGDTSFEPDCPQPEIEPNGSLSEAQYISLDLWICASFEDGVDLDYYEFDIEQPDWVKVDIQAVAHGSSADPVIYLFADGGETMDVNNRTDSTDPYLVFPMWEADTWTALLMDSFGGSGEDYTYDMMVSITKAPVGWTHVESEEENGPGEGPLNDTMDEAMDLEPGMEVFGRLAVAKDLDWYRIITPDEKTEVTVTVHASNFGSPLNSKLVFYTIDDNGDISDPYTYYGGEAGSMDPLMVRTADISEEWYLVLRSDTGDGLGYWYVIETEFN